MRAETPYPAGVGLLTGHERRTHNHCWRPRGTPVPLLIHTRAGQGVVRVRNAEHAISPGDTVLWAAGAPQDFSSAGAEPWEIVWAHFRPRRHWDAWMSWPALGPGVGLIASPQPRHRTRVEEALLDSVSAANSASPQPEGFALNALERALLWLDSANPGPRQLDDRVHEAVLYVSAHLDAPLSVAVIADAVQLSPSRLSHLFKEQTGVTPARFVELRRIDRAKGLLESSSLSIGAIAAATGFSSQFYFANRFRAATGTSPTSWRRRAAGDQ